jgi:hypothetical protein
MVGNMAFNRCIKNLSRFNINDYVFSFGNTHDEQTKYMHVHIKMFFHSSGSRWCDSDWVVLALRRNDWFESGRQPCHISTTTISQRLFFPHPLYLHPQILQNCNEPSSLGTQPPISIPHPSRILIFAQIRERRSRCTGFTYHPISSWRLASSSSCVGG